ncbi:ABC transporter permease [Novosphingobium sp. BW1]|uniref:ABC transporter permease n=1 Tax=Novosphingobium sp. BW1 TaxID=2592621 RepID=UPI0011DE856F|nr:ABC transporter permease [Novosphingobium sp. BW1]TYC93272.1 capsule biosynthesis protein [Novosphingobium sp. BW1]
MGRFTQALRVQVKVIKALMIRELVTRFGRENIGFLWIMAEPLMFASMVGLAWSILKGPQNHGVGVIPFVVSGYIPLTFMRHSFAQSAKIFVANSALLYHRQIKVLDFIFVRVSLEAIGAMMAYLFGGTVLLFFGYFPVPADVGMLILGWAIYVGFVLSVCLVLAPLSEVSEVVEKIIPVSVYLAIPFSGVFNMAAWLPVTLRDYLMWSPFVTGMELMRAGLFGDAVLPYYDIPKALTVTFACLVAGLVLCRRVRRMVAVS